MNLTMRQCLHTLRMAKLIDYANSLGLLVKVTEWNRLLETQKEYVARGVSWTLNSRHLDNCATDMYIVKEGGVICDGEPYRRLGVYFENMGGRWGGRFVPSDFEAKNGRNFDPAKDVGKDPYHFETNDS